MRLVDVEPFETAPNVNYCVIHYEQRGDGFVNGTVKRTKDIPTIDPVHAAGACYCRECKFSCLDFFSDNGTTRIEEYVCLHPRVGNMNTKVYSDHFCGYGERRVE